jgi:hypothetical protein
VPDPAEPAIAINGVRLTDPQAMTVRVALESFAITLATEGLGADEHGRLMVAAYEAQIREIRAMMYPKESTP